MHAYFNQRTIILNVTNVYKLDIFTNPITAHHFWRRSKPRARAHNPATLTTRLDLSLPNGQSHTTAKLDLETDVSFLIEIRQWPELIKEAATYS